MDKPTCSVAGCELTASVRGWCKRHYNRWRRYGDLNVRTPRGEDFWAHVERRAPDECWPWLGTVVGNGYGQIQYLRKRDTAHRWAYTLAIGPIPDGLVIDHTCHNGTDCVGGFACLHRRCCNPAHLEAVTHRENLLRGTTNAAALSAQTHCKAGHPLSGENLYLNPRGNRQCRECQRRRHREWEARQRAK